MPELLWMYLIETLLSTLKIARKRQTSNITFMCPVLRAPDFSL